ncbi:hypothetical protein [Streptomyces sp. NPDC058867]|uniref:hypothetical protein n=1 Tax=unclassified Streptomyces TaxID=2593676 RepID=UPI0036A8EB60
MTVPGPTPPAGPPDPPPAPSAPLSYRAPGLVPPSGPARTWGLVVIATPLLLAVALALFGGLDDSAASSGSSGASGSSGSSGSGAFSSDPFASDPFGSDPYGSGSLGSGFGDAADEPSYGAEEPTTAPGGPFDDSGTPDATASDGSGDDGYPDPADSLADTPRDVVLAYFAAINSRDYKTAWDLGGKNLASDYDEFVEGYATTEQDTVSIVSETGNDVRLTIEALQTDGTTDSYDVTYTVRDGVITDGKGTQTD